MAGRVDFKFAISFGFALYSEIVMPQERITREMWSGSGGEPRTNYLRFTGCGSNPYKVPLWGTPGTLF